MDSILQALQTIATPSILFFMVAGTGAGIIIGAMPGLGSVLAITLALPLTFVLGPEASIMLLLGLYCGSVYGGSISAILINTPGTPQAAATLFDGYPMMKKGKGGLALGWSTTASLIGGLLSTVVLIAAAPLLARLGLRFGPVEYFALGLFALTCVISVANEDLLRGGAACFIGLLAATIGQDPLTGDLRLHFSSFELSAGIGLVPFLVGLFALSEVFWRVSERHPSVGADVPRSGFEFPAIRELGQRWKVLFKSSMIGTWTGILPGIGATAASMISYAEAKRTSPNRDKFGTGEPDGIIASEAANNAVTSGALVPTLSLGIPGDPITAVMLGALVIQGVTPGPRLFVENADLVTFIFVALFFVNVAMYVLGVLLCPVFSRILRMPEPLLLSAVVVLIAIGTFTVNYNPFDLVVALVAGVSGFVLRLGRFPLAPIVIGFVLGPMIEQSFRQGMILQDGNFLSFFSQPIALVLFVLTALFVGWPIYRGMRERRARSHP
jgi:putative tricarboxylic transport membrane protein